MSKLTPGEWRILFPLLDSAWDLPAESRAAWLVQLSGVAPSLKLACGQLLEGRLAAQAHALPEECPKFTALNCPSAIPEHVLQAGDRIGPYRVLRHIGRGGMSSVWLAERADGVLKRHVALKLPHLAWQASELAKRMIVERDLLADLQHPNIARLYDAGVDEHGRPYLALEFIEGQSLDEYCRARACDLTAKLSIVASIARAVAYAHSRLIVHRDLKPSNILIDESGQVHLLDFGVGKLLEPQSIDGSAATLFEIRAITPDYASPEQILGAATSTGTDIYSLGVILYELLTGSRPYAVAAGAHTIACTEALPPSRQVSDCRLSRQLRGDLDTVVLRAIKREPGERYATMAAFADDIERFLQDRPVLARPDSRWCRLRRFARRNRSALRAAAALMLAVVAGVTAVWQARTARIEQAHAVSFRAFAAVIPELATLQGDSGASVPAENLWRLAKRNGRAPSSAGAKDAAGLVESIRHIWGERSPQYAQALAELGTLQIYRHSSAEGLQQLQRALDLMRKASGDDSVPVAAIIERLSSLYLFMDEYLKAAELNADAISIYQRTMHPALGRAKSQRGEILLRLGNTQEADQGLRDGLLDELTQLKERGRRAAADMLKLAEARVILGEYDDAEYLSRRALEVLSGVDQDSFHLGYANTMLSIALMKQAHYAEAEARLRQSLSIYERTLPADHQYVASSEHFLGQVLLQQGRLTEARTMLAGAIRRWRRSGAPNWIMLRSENVLGEVLYRQGATDAGIATVRESCRALGADSKADFSTKQEAAKRLWTLARARC